MQLDNMELYISTGEMLDLGETPNIKIDYTRFDLSKLDKVQATKTNSFNLPLTASNKKVLKGLGVVSSNTNIPYIHTGVSLSKKGNILIEEGVLLIEKTEFGELDSLKVNILDTRVSLFSKLKELELRDIGSVGAIVIDFKQDIPALVRRKHLHSDKIIVATAIYSDNSITSYPTSSFREKDLYKGLKDIESKAIEGLYPRFEYDLSYIRPQAFITWILKEAIEGLGYSLEIDPFIIDDLKELVISLKDISQEEEFEDIGDYSTFLFKPYKMRTLQSLMPDIKFLDLLKDIITKFNLDVDVDEFNKSVKLVHIDPLLKEFDKAEDLTRYVISKVKEGYDTKDYNLKNSYLYKDDKATEREENKKRDLERLSHEWINLDKKIKGKNDYQGITIFNNVNLEKDNKAFQSVLEVPIRSNITQEVLNYQRRKDGDTRGLYNVFGKIGLGDKVYPLINLSGEDNSVYGNEARKDNPIIFRLKTIDKPHYGRYIYTGDVSYWTYRLTSTPKRDLEDVMEYQLMFDNERTIKGNNGMMFFGDYALDFNEINERYDVVQDRQTYRALVTPTYNKLTVDGLDYMFFPGKVVTEQHNYPGWVDLEGLSEEEYNESIMFISDRVIGSNVTRGVYSLTGIKIDITEDEFFKQVSYEPQVFDDSYMYFGSNTGISDSFPYSMQTHLLTDKDLDFEYFLEKYHSNTRGVYSNYVEQEWTAILDYTFMERFNFNKLIYLEQEQSYYYVNEIKEFDVETRECTLKIVKVMDYIGDIESEIYLEKDTRITRVLFTRKYTSSNKKYVYRDSYSNSPVDYIELGTILFGEDSEIYTLKRDLSGTFLDRFTI